MPTTHISPVRSLSTRLDYVTYGSGRVGSERRRSHDASRPLSFACDFGTREDMAAYARQLRRRKQRRYDGYEVRVSWSRDELDPGSPDDVAAAMEFGRALADELFPGSPCAITAHGDGEGGCLHLHIDVVNVSDLGTGKSICGDGRCHRVVAAVSDTLARERGMRVVEFAAHEGSWAERRAELEASNTGVLERLSEGERWPRSLRDNTVALAIGNRIDEAIRQHATEISGVDDLERVLADKGVGIIRKEAEDGVGFTYTAQVELEGKLRKRRCKASKILRGYSADRIMETVAREAERQRAVDEEAQRRRSAQTVSVAPSASEGHTWVVRVDPAAMGVDDDEWAMPVREAALVSCAHSALQVMQERQPHAPIVDELQGYLSVETRGLRHADMPERIARDLAEACKDDILRGRHGDMPRTEGGFFARGFRLAMEASARDGELGIRTVLLGMLSAMAGQLDGVATGMRERARTVLGELGLIHAAEGGHTLVGMGGDAVETKTKQRKGGERTRRDFMERYGFDPMAGTGRMRRAPRGVTATARGRDLGDRGL